ncbi:putative histone-lysine n-methyltransferase set9 [Rosellinia necatrix]|uniref:Histone-lysine N-methyltransferase SET9 n=1 Tax=Rosellinia necatrix TaxID=77044 RepID=A0A1W2TI02_ROSNE|nr:putative histone-lysine n-methyltransferase set9 [Rosellinia necatrix]
MPAPTSAAKRQSITLAQLSSYDDILTDVLIDHAYYWTTIPKNRPSYRPSRGVTEEEITKVIQSHLIVDPDLDAAESKLLAADGVRRFYSGLKTPKEQADFRAHLRRYMRIYLPDCPFEVSSTNRYTIYSHEAAVTARKYIKKGQPIKYLSGIQVMITAKEDKELAMRKKDFSIVISSRNKCAALFMGPARFANHDCNANARLMITGQSGIEIVATQNIDVGDEITVSYADNYFGEDNCECLCKTCEENAANGWAQGGGGVGLKKSIEDSTSEGYSLRRRRRDDSCASGSRTPSVTPGIRPRIRKTKPKPKNVSSESESLHNSPAPQNILREKRKREYESLRSPPVTPSKRQKTLQYDVESVPILGGLDRQSSDDTTPSEHSASDSVSIDATATTDVTTPEATTPEATTPEEEAEEITLQSPALTPVRPRVIAPKEEEDLSSITGASRTPFVPVVKVESPPPLDDIPISSVTDSINIISSASASAVNSQADELPSADLIVFPAPVIDISEGALPASKSSLIGVETLSQPLTRGRQAVRGRPKRAEKDEEAESIDEPVEVTKKRVPGDYTLTPVLLSEPNTAWIHCTICNDAFVQRNAYYTRSSCFRCERHSKLYGFSWPKTENEGPNDKEERILDPRTIHRFLDTEEEARVRGRKVPAAVARAKAAARSNIANVGKRGPGRPRKYPIVQPNTNDADGSEDDSPTDARRISQRRRSSMKAVTC